MLTLSLVLPQDSYCWYWNNGSGYYEYGGVITAKSLDEAQEIANSEEFLKTENVSWTDVIVCKPNETPNP